MHFSCLNFCFMLETRNPESFFLCNSKIVFALLCPVFSCLPLLVLLVLWWWGGQEGFSSWSSWGPLVPGGWILLVLWGSLPFGWSEPPGLLFCLGGFVCCLPGGVTLWRGDFWAFWGGDLQIVKVVSDFTFFKVTITVSFQGKILFHCVLVCC